MQRYRLLPAFSVSLAFLRDHRFTSVGNDGVQGQWFEQPLGRYYAEEADVRRCCIVAVAHLGPRLISNS
ncbi:hypothetical protein RZS28_03500 [Methylocapsa polymorpha]|uniref:Uncharacterized protein n=1 Tax=Methylocapsa polymorpha TaxID=3080828 RepID=A0ABZ0HT53_9HYPH|nr:hypothetical protein RZS28_03500 [Methylocapsa sp. RX1]